MARKFKNYVREWRRVKGLTQRQLLDRLAELEGTYPPEDPALKIPRTEASLSRIEAGRQNCNVATLEAIAKALDVDEAGWLLARNPEKAGEVVQLQDYAEKLDNEQAGRAIQVLMAIFGDRA